MHMVIASGYLTERVPSGNPRSRKKWELLEYCFALCSAKCYRSDERGAVAPELYQHKKRLEANFRKCQECERLYDLLCSAPEEELTVYLMNQRFVIPSYRMLAAEIDAVADPGTEIGLFKGEGSMLSRLEHKTGRWQLSGDWRMSEIILVAESLARDFGWRASYEGNSLKIVCKEIQIYS